MRWLAALLFICGTLATAGGLPGRALAQDGEGPGLLWSTPACPGLLPTRLILYERGRVTADMPTPSNLRLGPGTIYERIGEVPANDIFFVLEGPRCSQRYTWYRVHYAGREGWVAEGASNSYYVEPYPPG